jgi:hypothetical protein
LQWYDIQGAVPKLVTSKAIEADRGQVEVQGDWIVAASGKSVYFFNKFTA